MAEEFRAIFKKYSEITVRYDAPQEAVWCYFNPKERPCFSPQLLREAKEIQCAIIRYFQSDTAQIRYPVRYLILASQTPGVFNFGGDLELFIQLITKQNREKLFDYAKSCIDICYMNAVNLNLPLTTISLVEGSALGGGLESALSSNVLIAESHVQMGVPEIRFNLFPGMGAYSFLARKVGMRVAEQVLQQGRIYSARELHDMFVVDVLAESGKGYEAVDTYIKHHRMIANGLRAIQAVKQLYHPVTYEELVGITTIWVDAALRLSEKDLRIMRKLVAAQNRDIARASQERKKMQVVRTKQDRRVQGLEAHFPLIDDSGRKIFVDRRRSDRRSLAMHPVEH